MRIKERRRAESHGMQEGKLIGAGPAQHVSLPADDRDHDAGHVRGHHKCRRLHGGSVVPSGERGFFIFHVRSHGPFHQPPDHQGDDQNHAERVDPRRRLDKKIVHHQRIFEKSKIAFDTVLALVGSKYSLGIQRTVACCWNVGKGDGNC